MVIDNAFALYFSCTYKKCISLLVIVQTGDEMQKGYLLHSIYSVFPMTTVLHKDIGLLKKSRASAFITVPLQINV